jgi:hypothetical protein
MKRLLIMLFAAAIVLVNENSTAQVKRTSKTTRMSNNADLAFSSQQAQLQGTIFFADNNILQQLQQGWNANLSQAIGNKIKVELWQVNYVPDKKDNIFTDVLLVQRLDANVSYQVIQNGVQFSVNYKQVAGNIVVVAYADAAPNATVRFIGKPNDGTPASMTHQFKSDVKRHMGLNIIYGLYSLTNQGGVSADFQIKSTIKTNCNSCFSFDDVVNAAGDVVNDVLKFTKATLDGAADAVSKVGEAIVVDNSIFFVQCFGTIATFLQTGNTPKVRMLSDYGNAYNIANSTIFMGTLPPIDHIIVTNLMSIDKRPFTVPVENGNNVYVLMNLGNAFDDPLNYSWNGFHGDVFIHELTHAWQIWHKNELKLFQEGAVNQFKNSVISDQYHYNCDGHNIADSYNTEQQAMIVQNFYDILFFSQDGIVDKNRNKTSCDFEQQWVVQNILNNQPANIDAQFTATAQIIAASHNRATAGYTGGVIDHSIASPSNGNRIDGAGYYLPGKNNNSFFYYSNKTKAASANWGQVRDKYIKDNYEYGELGWPEISESPLPDRIGFFQRFNHGFIYWHPRYGAYVVLNKIFDAWKTVGWEAGQLGYPMADYVLENPPKSNASLSEFADKGYQKFVGGVIFYALPANAMALARGNQNLTTIQYGDPDRIIALHNQATTSLRPGQEVQINPQPLPPGSKQSTSSIHRPADNVQINPQPLPPDPSPNVGSTVRRPADNVQINPQPLPPKIKRNATSSPASVKVQINPQPLPPKQN